MNLIPYLTSWAVLAIAVLVVAAYRITVSRRDDASLDVLEQNPIVIAAQYQAVRKIKTLDHWGEALTIITASYGLVIAVVYLRYLWVLSLQIPR